MHLESRNDSASVLRFFECMAIHEFSFEQQMALHASEIAVSNALHTLEPKIIIRKIRKGWSELQGAVFTLISKIKAFWAEVR